MKVREWMSRRPTTVGPDVTVKEAFWLMKTKGIRHLPVVENGRLRGIVTDRDLRRPRLADTFRSWHELYRISDEFTVADIMISPVLIIEPEAPVRRAAEIMVRKKIGALPVVDRQGSFVGILTETDILKAFIASIRTAGE